MKKKNPYNKDYYENGVELGISGYSDYRWLPDLTVPMCEKIVEYLNIKKDHTILDFGCAKGYSVKALTELGYNCLGTAISEYAISRAPEAVRDKLFLYDPELFKKPSFFDPFDFIIAKDVFEHIQPKDLEKILSVLSPVCGTMFVVVPLGENGKYVASEYEGDVTHVIREDINWWSDFFKQNNFEVESYSYRVLGVKDNWSHYPKGNGFFILKAPK